MHTTSGIDAVFDEHLRCEFQLHDAASTMQTMTDTPHLYHVPTMSGGNSKDEVYVFYRDHFVKKWPADTSVTRISRTIGGDQVVDELVMSFTHDVVMDPLLPGVAPTGKKVKLPVVVVVKFVDGKVAHEHIYWDQASLLVQVGLLDAATLPATGVEQAEHLLNGSFADNRLIR
jgi:carboxymethylenebutenolidase